MIFTESQKRELYQIIQTQVNNLIGINLGFDILFPKDKELLKKHGINPDQKIDWPPYLQSFMFGRLAAYLSDSQLKTLTYEDFIQYLLRHQYTALSQREIKEYNIARQKTYAHIQNIGDRLKSNLEISINNEDQKYTSISEKYIKDEVKSAILRKESVKAIVSNLIKKTGLINTDWGRIVDTEMHDIYSRGKAAVFKDGFGLEQKVYKQTYSGACRWCIKLHLKNGIGSEPIAYTLEQLYQNGTNIGLKPENWKAVIGSTHPFCRCDLRLIFNDEKWDKEKKKFVVSSNNQTINRKSKVYIKVGEKEFYI